MKKKIVVLLASLGVLGLLSGCSVKANTKSTQASGSNETSPSVSVEDKGKEITKEQAKAQLDLILAKEQETDFVWPTKLTYSQESLGGNDPFSSMCRFDGDAHYYYRSLESTNPSDDKTEIIYVDGTKLIQKSTIASDNHDIDEGTVEAAVSAFNEKLENFSPKMVAFQTIDVETLLFFKADPNDGSYSGTYYSNGDGNFSADVQVTAIQKETSDSRSTASNAQPAGRYQFSFDNYLPRSLSIKTNHDGNSFEVSMIYQAGVCDSSIKTID